MEVDVECLMTEDEVDCLMTRTRYDNFLMTESNGRDDGTCSGRVDWVVVIVIGGDVSLECRTGDDCRESQDLNGT